MDDNTQQSAPRGCGSATLVLARARGSATIPGMARLSVTLDPNTEARLARQATRAGLPRATFARRLLREALARREARTRRWKLAADYAAGHRDARALLAELEGGALELWARARGR